MKRLSIPVLLTVVILLASCNVKTESDSADSTKVAAGDNSQSKHQEMFETNRAVYRAIETGDSVTLRKHISSDATDHGGGPDGADIKGDEIVRMLTSVHHDIDNLKFEVVQEAANDDHIFTLVHMTGTTNKPVWGMPANHKVDGNSIDLIKVKDNKMVDHWNFMEVSEMMKMMNQSGGGSKQQ